MEAINKARLRVWAQQPPESFDEAILDVDGTLVATAGECKQGVDIAYDGTWGYHPLLVSLANTAEPLYLVNRPGNRPSHERTHAWIDQALAWCRRAGFRRTYLRGDTDFSQARHLDRWDEAGDVRFLFGMWWRLPAHHLSIVRDVVAPGPLFQEGSDSSVAFQQRSPRRIRMGGNEDLLELVPITR
jgi:hypothetical protein